MDIFANAMNLLNNPNMLNPEVYKRAGEEQIRKLNEQREKDKKELLEMVRGDRRMNELFGDEVEQILYPNGIS